MIERTQFIRDYLDRLKKDGLMQPNDIIDKIALNVIHGKISVEHSGLELEAEGQPGVRELVDLAIDEKISLRRVVQESLFKPMETAIQKFHDYEYLMPHVLASAHCVTSAMDRLTPILEKSEIANKGKFVIATVKEDQHETGKNIVALLLKATGYEVIDLGKDVSADRIVETVKNHQAPFLGLSCLLSYTMSEIEEIITKIEAKDFRDDVKILVGGTFLLTEFAERLGADFFCGNVFYALDLLEQIRN